MRIVALLLLLVVLAFAVKARSIKSICDSHCANSCSKIQTGADYVARCNRVCTAVCDPRASTLSDADAKFLKKAFKKIGGALKKVGKVAGKVGKVISKVSSLPGQAVGKVVNKMPLPKGLKKVLNVVAPIAVGAAISGGVGSLGALKGLAGVQKAISAVKATKVYQTAMKIKKGYDTIKGKVNAVRNLAKGKLIGIKDLVKGKIGLGEKILKGKAGQFVSKLKNTKLYKTYENVKKRYDNVKGKIQGTINKYKQKYQNVVRKVDNIKNKYLNKFDKFGKVGQYIKGAINDKIDELGQRAKDKLQNKIDQLKEKLANKLKNNKLYKKYDRFRNNIRNAVDKVKSKVNLIEDRYDELVNALTDL
jgi:hypothetical protein